MSALLAAAGGGLLVWAGWIILRRHGGAHPSPLGLLKTGGGILLLVGGLVLAVMIAPILYLGSR